MRAGNASDSTEVEVASGYSIGETIASDALGTLHVGRYLGPAGFTRIVLIKRLHRRYATDPEFISVFATGARLAAKVQHPHVVSTLDVVVSADMLLWVTEFAPGQTLARLLHQRREPSVPRLACAIVSGVLHGLGAAHDVRTRRAPGGILHGSLTPEHVIVGYDGLARVAGLGMARTLDWLETTREGRLGHSLAYTAPELVRGDPFRTRQTDLFAASVIFWEALTGRPLFLGANAAETFENVLEMPIPSPREHAPAVSEAVARVVMRGLARDPTRRYASAREMIAALDATRELAGVGELGEWAKRV
jgi:eukaryotic-like serine/threonine-protein kinase